MASTSPCSHQQFTAKHLKTTQARSKPLKFRNFGHERNTWTLLGTISDTTWNVGIYQYTKLTQMIIVLTPSPKHNHSIFSSNTERSFKGGNPTVKMREGVWHHLENRILTPDDGQTSVHHSFSQLAIQRYLVSLFAHSHNGRLSVTHPSQFGFLTLHISIWRILQRIIHVPHTTHNDIFNNFQSWVLTSTDPSFMIDHLLV